MSEGLLVNTQSEMVLKARTGMMQLILARAPKNKALLALAKKMGVEGTTPFPTVTQTQRDCILCGLCVDVCEQVIGASAIGFANRGVNRMVAAPFLAAAEDCIGCGACAAVCPVGTIKLRHKEGQIEISPFRGAVKERYCTECGARLTGEPFAQSIEGKLGRLRGAATLCAVCKRKHNAAASVKVAAVSRKRQGARAVASAAT